MKYLMLELLFLLIRWCFPLVPLSLIKEHIIAVHYYVIAMSPKIIIFYNNKENNIQPLITNKYEALTFTVIVRKTIGCLNLLLDNIKQSNTNLCTFNDVLRTEFVGINTINSTGITHKGTYIIDFI